MWWPALAGYCRRCRSSAGWRDRTADCGAASECAPLPYDKTVAASKVKLGGRTVRIRSQRDQLLRGGLLGMTRAFRVCLLRLISLGIVGIRGRVRGSGPAHAGETGGWGLTVLPGGVK